jgi:6-phosphofructokinase 1
VSAQALFFLSIIHVIRMLALNFVPSCFFGRSGQNSTCGASRKPLQWKLRTPLQLGKQGFVRLQRRTAQSGQPARGRSAFQISCTHGRPGGSSDAREAFDENDADFILSPEIYQSLSISDIDSGRYLKSIPRLQDFLPASQIPRVCNPATSKVSFRGLDNYDTSPNDVVLKQTVINPDKRRNFARYLRAGPRSWIAFRPEEVRAAIVTCGGLCPGINTVIRELTDGLWHLYDVRSIVGIRGGYRGFYNGTPYLELSPRTVDGIHRLGGTILGSSRGGFDLEQILGAIRRHGLNQLYIIGGDGTIRGAAAIAEACMRERLRVSVASIPKTIDNDIPVIDHSFGFMTAVEEAQRALNAAHVEATCFPNGIGIVRLMGRNSGFIAMYASLANRDVDCCLIPELPFEIEGPNGLAAFVEKRLQENGHFLLVVAEGAGQDLLAASTEIDASGNRKFNDIGLYLKERLQAYFNRENIEVSMKYIDPTYMVRAVPATASDQMYCAVLAHSAIHGAMAGFTSFTVGPVNGRHAMIPLQDVAGQQQRVDIRDRTWSRLLSSTGQPSSFLNQPAAALHQTA